MSSMNTHKSVCVSSPFGNNSPAHLQSLPLPHFQQQQHLVSGFTPQFNPSPFRAAPFQAQRHGAMILVQTESFPRDDCPILINGVKHDELIQFHLVDLKGNDIQHDCVPPLVSLGIITTMVVLNGSIFIFGGLYKHIVDSGQSNQLESQSLESPLKFYLGGSRIKLKLDQSQGEGEEWVTVPRPDVCFPRCISFLGKIYTFPTKPMVLDDGNWRELPLPSPLADSRIYWAIPDPANHRILVLLSDVDDTVTSLYAFTPPDCCPTDVHGTESVVGKWDLIDPHFRDMFLTFTLVDDVIYFHSEEIRTVICAYDLNSRAWLDVSWSSSFTVKVDMNNAYIGYDEFLYLGDKTFCLIDCARYPGPFNQHSTEIFFYIFKAERFGSSLILDPVTIKSCVIPGIFRAKKFLAV